MNFFKKHLSLKSKRNMIGYFFVLPFVIGFLLFFLVPFIQAIVFSLNEIEMTGEGYQLIYQGFGNYEYVIYTHPRFNQLFVETVIETLIDIPLIIIFSFFAAILLNQKFRGRFLARTIFFLPVIMGAGIILSMEAEDYMAEIMATQIGEEAQTGLILGVNQLSDLLIEFNLPVVLIDYLMDSVDQIAEVIRSSGVQIIVFLAGLQSISPSLYEVAIAEGATPWEKFWKITFPMLTPILLTNVVYTIIDSFVANDLVDLIRDSAVGAGGYGISSAMSMIYLLFIAVLLIIIVGLISRGVYYHE